LQVRGFGARSGATEVIYLQTFPDLAPVRSLPRDDVCAGRFAAKPELPVPFSALGSRPEVAIITGTQRDFFIKPLSLVLAQFKTYVVHFSSQSRLCEIKKVCARHGGETVTGVLRP
jgi:hypothetical protein